MEERYVEQLHEELHEFGIGLSDELEALLLKHLELVIEKNQVLNLTRISSPEAGVTLHVVDSLLLLPAFRETEGPYLDLGTGAGFPGLPAPAGGKPQPSRRLRRCWRGWWMRFAWMLWEISLP